MFSHLSVNISATIGGIGDPITTPSVCLYIFPWNLNTVEMTRLYANCLDNIIYEYDLKQENPNPVFFYTGHVTDSFYVKLDISPDDSYVICGSSDRQAHIYTVGKRQQQPIVLSGHTGEVSVARWCRGDPTRIVTLSDESQAFVWNMFPARQYCLPEPGELA
ncbi:unnamed protein product, partial [Trichobilharzia regenti]